MTRTRILLCAALMLAAPALTGCGFKPLYATTGNGAMSSQVVGALAGITIRPIADRQGMKLRQTLSERLQTNGAAPTKPYVLDVRLSSQVQELGVRPDSTTSRANLIFISSFSLSEGGAEVFSDTVQSIVSYNILDDQYATVASEGDAEDRAIRQIGEEIKTRLAVYFDQRFNPATASTH